MYSDPIVEEVREARQEYARQFDFDLRAMVADLRRREKEHPELVVTLPSKPVRRRKSA